MDLKDFVQMHTHNAVSHTNTYPDKKMSFLWKAITAMSRAEIACM